MAQQIRHNWMYDPGRPGYQDPEYAKAGYPDYGAPKPAITAFGNIQYLDLIYMIKEFWRDAHPEIPFVGVGDNQKYSPDQGYLVHSLIRRIPKDNFPKLRLLGEYCIPDTNEALLVFMQPFLNLIKFSSVHSDPETADQIIEEFETFFLQAIPFLEKAGVENIWYRQRLSDDSENRDGQDVAVRAITYEVALQKIIYSRLGTLQQIYLRIQTMMGVDCDATPSLPGILEYIYPHA